MKVIVVIGSASDKPIADKCTALLGQFGVPFELRVASAHRTPDKVAELAAGDADLFIAIAGLSAALPGVVASLTTKPVIAVPVNVKLDGLDALLSCMQMPPGIPVATVGIDRGDNAALLAVSILSLKDEALKKKLEDYRKKMADKVVASDKEVNS